MQTSLLATVALVFLVLPATAQTPSQAPRSSPPTSSGSAAELMALERFLDLSDAELAQMADAIARLRAMTPAQRAALRGEIAAFRQLPEPERQQIRQGWGGMPAEIQDGWRDMMHNATPEERAAIQSKMHSLSADERTLYRRTLVESYLKNRQGAKK
jgi:hypothetical protein